MSRASSVVIAVALLMQSAAAAMAGGWGCRDIACFPDRLPPPYHFKRVHNFRPRLLDGAPVVTDFPSDPEGYYGVGCVTSWRPVMTEHGPAWGFVPYCVSY